MPEFLTRLFTNDTELIKVCVPIVYVLCFFQVFDGLQVTLSGIFRGLKKTTIVMITNIIAYWFIAFPVGCVLAFKLDLNLIGFWYAIGLSAILICLTLSSVLYRKFKKLV